MWTRTHCGVQHGLPEDVTWSCLDWVLAMPVITNGTDRHSVYTRHFSGNVN